MLGYRNSEGDGGGFLNFVGRFHILIVHLPIGVIFLSAIMEILTRLPALSHLRASVLFVNWIAFLGAILATLVGYLLMSVEGFAGRAMDLHMYFGLAVVVCTFFAVFFSLKNKIKLTTLSTFAAVAMSMSSGHFGGAMVHEGDYLVEHAPEPFKPFLLLGLESDSDAEKIAAESGEGEEVVEVALADRPVYADFVVPILEAKCNECHNENKIKGDLRMDTHELLLAGSEGSDYPTVVPGNADDSEMIVRVMLPEDDDEFMPPKGDPLTPEEVELLSLWIQAGATQETTVAQLGSDPAIEQTVLAVDAIHTGGDEVVEVAGAEVISLWDTLSPEEQQERMDEVAAAASKFHFSVMPISAEDDRLRVNVINAAKEFGDDQLALLEPVADQIVWLDLARSQVTDEGMKTVGQMKSLERLHLENTTVTDEGIKQIGSLAGLEYLNLYGTKVGNGIFETFKTLPALNRVYVWQTEVTPGEARAFEKSVNLEINTGVELAAAAPAPPAEEPAKAEEKPAPKSEEKKPEPKPAAQAAKPAPKQAEKKQETPANTAAKPAEKKPAPKTAAKPAPKKEEKADPKPKETEKPAPKKADAPPAPKKENAKPATDAKKETPPAPKKAAEEPKVKKADTPPAPKKADN
ncbi:MAG: c-type cytochrome domain-containing protein [Verrucomicrobiota bacterium]